VAWSTLLIISIGFTTELSPTKRIAMSKGQKGNKENKKAKADKNRVKNVSAYKATQSLGKPAGSQLGKKT
jgi:hypothetical protein